MWDARRNDATARIQLVSQDSYQCDTSRAVSPDPERHGHLPVHGQPGVRPHSLRRTLRGVIKRKTSIETVVSKNWRRQQEVDVSSRIVLGFTGLFLFLFLTFLVPRDRV